MSDNKDRRASADKQPKRRRTASNLGIAKKADGKVEPKTEVKADALENLDIPETEQIEYSRLMHRKSFNDIFAGLVPAELAGNSEGIRAIAAAAKARQNEEALQANQVQANMQHLQQVQAAQQLQHVSSLSAATAAAMAVAQASNNTNGDPAQQVAQRAAKAAAEAAQQHNKPRPAPIQMGNNNINPNIAAMLAAKQQSGMFSPSSTGTPQMFSPNPMGMSNANQLSMILQQNQNGMQTPTTPNAMNAFTPALLQAQVQFAQQAQAQAHQHDEQDKKVKRLAKNRIAAKECRLKKKKYVKCLEERVKLLEERNEKLLAEVLKWQSGKMSEEDKIAQQSRIETEYKQDVGSALPENPETPMASNTPNGGQGFIPASSPATSAAHTPGMDELMGAGSQQKNMAVLETKLPTSS